MRPLPNCSGLGDWTLGLDILELRAPVTAAGKFAPAARLRACS